MVTETTEKTTTSKLEAAITESAIEETAELSEETAGKIEEPEEGTEEKEAIKWTDEQQSEIDRLVQGESDRRTNTYRQRHESNSELIKALQDENANLKRQVSNRASEGRLKKFSLAADEEGLDEQDRKPLEEQLKEYNQKIDEYQQNIDTVEATVKYINEMAKGIDPTIAKQFYLDDPNPNIRAGGGLELINEAIANIQEYKNFLMVVEQFFPKGDEVRKQLEDVIKGMADYEGNDKAKKLFLSSQEKGFRARPRKAPPSPSQTGGGEDLSNLSMTERLARHIEQADRK